MPAFRSTRALPLGVAVASLAVLASACSSTSASGSGGGGGGSLNLVAYSTPQKVYEALIPQFNATADGKGVSFKQSYGASGSQSRAVLAGQPADIVAFSLQPDMSKLVDADLVASDWNSDQYHGMVTDS